MCIVYKDRIYPDKTPLQPPQCYYLRYTLVTIRHVQCGSSPPGQQRSPPGPNFKYSSADIQHLFTFLLLSVFQSSFNMLCIFKSSKYCMGFTLNNRCYLNGTTNIRFDRLLQRPGSPFIKIIKHIMLHVYIKH